MTSTGAPRRSGWICPACRRRFARAKQWHSCKPQAVSTHFARKDPALRNLFDVLVSQLEKSGPLRVDAVKTSINLISRHHFAGVTVRREHLRVGFLADKPIASPRIARRDVLGPHRVGHVVLVSRRQDIDAELLRWLADAQRLQA